MNRRPHGQASCQLDSGDVSYSVYLRFLRPNALGCFHLIWNVDRDWHQGRIILLDGCNERRSAIGRVDDIIIWRSNTCWGRVYQSCTSRFKSPATANVRCISGYTIIFQHSTEVPGHLMLRRDVKKRKKWKQEGLLNIVLSASKYTTINNYTDSRETTDSVTYMGAKREAKSQNERW